MTKVPASKERPTVKSYRDRRQPTSVRKVQIVQATLRVIAEHGISGATLSRIAEKVGITDAALYRHFRSREEILLAAHHALVERVYAWLNSSHAPNVIDRLRELGEMHSVSTSADIECFNAPMFQFISWIPKDDLRKEVTAGRLGLRQWFTDLVEEGKAQGSIRADISTQVIVAQLIAWIWWEDLSYLEAIDIEATQRTSADMFRRFLSGISASCSASTSAPCSEPQSPE